MDDLRKNPERYMDLTAYEALEKASTEEKENERFNKLLHTIFYLCKLAGFKIDGRIVLVDKRSGRVWK